jgi:hypothetical protein
VRCEFRPGVSAPASSWGETPGQADNSGTRRPYGTGIKSALPITAVKPSIISVRLALSRAAGSIYNSKTPPPDCYYSLWASSWGRLPFCAVFDELGPLVPNHTKAERKNACPRPFIRFSPHCSQHKKSDYTYTAITRTIATKTATLLTAGLFAGLAYGQNQEFKSDSSERIRSHSRV